MVLKHIIFSIIFILSLYILFGFIKTLIIVLILFLMIFLYQKHKKSFGKKMIDKRLISYYNKLYDLFNYLLTNNKINLTIPISKEFYLHFLKAKNNIEIGKNISNNEINNLLDDEKNIINNSSHPLINSSKEIYYILREICILINLEYDFKDEVHNIEKITNIQDLLSEIEFTFSIIIKKLRITKEFENQLIINDKKIKGIPNRLKDFNSDFTN
jgi:hypothetical protein